MANIAKHFSYIEASVAYLRRRVKREPQILGTNIEESNVSDLNNELNDCLGNMKLAFGEILALRRKSSRFYSFFRELIHC